MATRAQKLVTLREQFEQTFRELQAQRRFTSERKERQAIGRSEVLSEITDDMRTIRADMKPADVQKVIEYRLDQLGEQKASWMINATPLLRERRKHGINQLGKWTAEGAIAQIDEAVEQIRACLSKQWRASSPKVHGRYFQVYHSLDTMIDRDIGKQRWFSGERMQWYQDVAILQLKQPERQLEEVYRLTNHIGNHGWHQNREVIWVRETDQPTPRSTEVADVIVSLLSGAAWMTVNVGFELLVPQNE